MKKLLIIIFITLILILTIYTIMNGLQIGSFTIWGINSIQGKNKELSETITTASKLSSSTFPGKINEVNTSMKKLEEQKNIYQDMVATSDTENIEASTHLSKYTLEYLWTEIGTHATSEGVNIDISLTAGAGGANVYDLNFTASGSYVGICEFIRNIENDSDLAFKIEQFKMTVGESTSVLKATFICRNIPIEGISSISSNKNESTNESNTTNTTNNTTNTDNTNTTNTNNTNSRTNTTNNTSY